MSVLVRGMEMPKNCERCKFCFAITSDHIGKCAALEEFVDNVYKQRSTNCPLIEVQTPHGRLIDADALNTYDVSPFYGFCVMGVTEENIGLAPTIIEEEV